MDVKTRVERAYKENASSLISALMGVVRDLDFAEDVLQDAIILALKNWGTDPPTNPAGWLLTTARRKAIDRIRHQKMSSSKEAAIQLFQSQLSGDEDADALEGYGDEGLRLLFTCCHPSLSQEAQVALTLKTVCGLSILEISNAFLVNEATLSKRIGRAKTKIKLAAIPYEIPPLEKLLERMNAVLAVIYLVFNAGYHSSGPELVKLDLCQEAIRLSDRLNHLMAQQSPTISKHISALESQALGVLMKLNHARIRSRISDVGELVTLEEQNRSLWDHEVIEKEAMILADILRKANLGPYQLQAAIAALHASAHSSKGTDWIQIVGLYNELFRFIPTDIVRLNRAAAVAMAYSTEAGLKEIQAIEDGGALKYYSLLPAAKADLLRRQKKTEEALVYYKHAIALASGEKEIDYYKGRIKDILEASSKTFI